MKKGKYVATLEQVGEVIRRVDLSRLDNRLVGKPLIELEHCLIEIIDNLTDSHRTFNEIVAELARNCIEADSKDQFRSAYSEYGNEKSYFGEDYNLASPVGYYFRALLDRLTAIEDKQVRAGKRATVSHARMLTIFLVQQIERMWQSKQYTNEKIERLWEYWMSAK